MKRVIKKYRNRRLYDTTDSQYLTLPQLYELVKSGISVKVITDPEKLDVTGQTLIRAIIEVEGEGMDTNLLHRVIQKGDLVDSLKPDELSHK